MRSKRKTNLRGRKPSRSMSSSQFYKGRMTIAGSDRARVSQQKEYRRKKLSKQKRDARLSQFKGYLKLLGVVGAFLIVLNSMQIKSTEIVSSNLSEADSAELSSTVDEYLSGFLSRSKLLLNEANLSTYILQNASFVSDVRVSTDIFSTKLKIEAAIKEPLFNYLVTGQKDSPNWISSDGTLLTLKNDQLTDKDLPTISIRDNSGVDYNSGARVLSTAAVAYISSLSEELLGEDHLVNQVVLESSPREYRFAFSNKKYNLLVSSERPVESIVSDLISVVGTSGGRSAEDYIDLRIVDKAFVR